MVIPAAAPLHQTLVIIIAESLTSPNQLLGTLLVMKILVPILLILVTPPKFQQYRSLLPLIIRLQLSQDKKNHIRSREKWQNNVANSMPIILRKFGCQIPIDLSQIFVALW